MDRKSIILPLSISASLDRAALEKQQLFVRIIFTVWLFMIPYSTVYFYLGAYLSALACLITAAVLVPGAYFLDKNKYHIEARIMCVLCCVFVITLSSVGLGNKVNLEYYFLPAMMLSLLLFDPHHKKAIGFSIFIAFFIRFLNSLSYSAVFGFSFCSSECFL